MKLILGYDDNLGIAEDFASATGLATQSYHDLDEIIKLFTNKKLDLAFIPAGSLPYLTKPYQVIAQATFGQARNLTLQSNLITAKNIPLAEISQHPLGRINSSCTTSYWAPLIYFDQKIPPSQKLNFVGTNGFVDLLDKISQQKIDAGMVWDIIMQQNPKLTEKVHILASVTHLPTPVIVGQPGLSAELINKISHFTTEDKNFFFNGYHVPDSKLIETYLSHIKQACQYFSITI